MLASWALFSTTDPHFAYLGWRQGAVKWTKREVAKLHYKTTGEVSRSGSVQMSASVGVPTRDMRRAHGLSRSRSQRRYVSC
jgi:hypothetical protein